MWQFAACMKYLGFFNFYFLFFFLTLGFVLQSQHFSMLHTEWTLWEKYWLEAIPYCTAKVQLTEIPEGTECCLFMVEKKTDFLSRVMSVCAVCECMLFFKKAVVGLLSDGDFYPPASSSFSNQHEMMVCMSFEVCCKICMCISYMQIYVNILRFLCSKKYWCLYT